MAASGGSKVTYGAKYAVAAAAQNWNCDVFWKQLNGLILVPFTRGSDKLNYQERIEVPRKIAVKLFLHNQ